MDHLPQNKQIFLFFMTPLEHDVTFKKALSDWTCEKKIMKQPILNCVLKKTETYLGPSKGPLATSKMELFVELAAFRH